MDLDDFDKHRNARSWISLAVSATAFIVSLLALVAQLWM